MDRRDEVDAAAMAETLSCIDLYMSPTHHHLIYTSSPLLLPVWCFHGTSIHDLHPCS